MWRQWLWGCVGDDEKQMEEADIGKKGKKRLKERKGE